MGIALITNNILTDSGAELTGYVPYTGATADVNLGTFDLTAERGTFANNGSSDTLTVNHTSGSGKGINVSKGGNGEALLVTKTSGSGNAVTITGGLFSAEAAVFSGGITTNLTAGSVPFIGASGLLSQDNTNLFWDDINKRLGVGTNAPDYNFQVNGSIRFGSSTTLTNNTYFDNTTFRLGIGSQTPTRKLEVIENGSSLVANFRSTTGNVSAISLSNNASTADQIRIGSNGASLALSTNFTQKFAIFNTGNVLIQDAGTFTDAGFRLDVNGTARVQGVLTTTADAVVNGVNIGLGGGALTGNTRLGANALNANTTGAENTAIGSLALSSNTTGSTNTVFGVDALRSNTTGSSNTANGHRALFNNTTGSVNIAIGINAARRIADGSNLTISNNSVFIGSDSRAAADNQTNQIVIGHTAIGLGSNTTVIGNSSTTFGRWFGNLLVGSSTNSGQQLQVTGTSLLNGLSTIQGTTASDSGQLGAELTTTGSGTNWTGTSFATGYTHAVGSTVPLSTSLVATNGIYYQIAYTITGRTAGSITISYGGVSTSGITATGAVGPRAISTVPLSIVPTTDFDGTLVLSIKVISASSASVTFNSSAGTTTNQIRISSINSNTFVGRESGRNNTTATANSFFGAGSGQSNTTGTNNSFFGNASGQANITGTQNSFFGSSSGLNNTTAVFNSFFGVSSGAANTTGSSNSFFGASSGLLNTIGESNSFFGRSSGVANTTGGANSFFGLSSGGANTTGSLNAFFGTSAGGGNTTGAANSFFGHNSGVSISAGSNNVIIGQNAARFAGSGTTAMTSLFNSIYLGFQTRGLNATGSTNEIVIGYDVVGLGSNTTVLGNSSTTHGRWFGNLLIGTSTNNGTNLRVVGTTQSDTITQNLASHGVKVLQYTSVSSTTINLPTEFPLMTGLVVANSYAVFGKFLGKYVSYGQAIEFYISKNPNGFWNTVAYSDSSQFIASLVSVTGSGNDLTITTQTDTSFILELTVMTQS